jgi:hypothetical protein
MRDDKVIDNTMQEQVANQSFSAIGEYYAELSRMMETSQEPKRFARFMMNKFGSDYSIAIMYSLEEMESLHKEISQILDDFSGRSAGLFKYRSSSTWCNGQR